MSGKKGSTTPVSGHVGCMKSNMCPLTDVQAYTQSPGYDSSFRSRDLPTDRSLSVLTRHGCRSRGEHQPDGPTERDQTYGKKGSTTQVSGHVGRMKSNMYPLTEHQRTHTAQGTTQVSCHVACTLTEHHRTHTSRSPIKTSPTNSHVGNTAFGPAEPADWYRTYTHVKSCGKHRASGPTEPTDRY